MKIKSNAEIFKEKLEYEKKQSLQEDLRYIKNDIIAKQKNGKYCKYSRIAHCITVVDITKEKYLDYWLGTLKSKKIFDEDIKLIEKAIDEKFKSGLSDLSKVLQLELQSGDRKEEIDSVVKAITSIK